MKLTIVLVLLNITFSMYGDFTLKFYCPDMDPSNFWRDAGFYKEILDSRWHELRSDTDNIIIEKIKRQSSYSSSGGPETYFESNPKYNLEMTNLVGRYGHGRLYTHYYSLNKHAVGSYPKAKDVFFKDCIDLNFSYRDSYNESRKLNEENWKKKIEIITQKILKAYDRLQLSNDELIRILRLPQPDSTKSQINALRSSIEMMKKEISLLREEKNVVENNRHHYGL